MKNGQEVLLRQAGNQPRPNHQCVITDGERCEAQLAQQVAQLELRLQAFTTELHTAKAQLEVLLNHSTDGIVLVAPDLTIRQTNAVLQHLLGYTPEECEGQTLTRLIQTEETMALVHLLTLADAEQQAKPRELRIKHQNGTAFEAELTVEATKDHGFVCTIRDISERKAYERQLRESKKMLELVLDTIPVRVFWKDRDSIIQGCNQLFAQDMGFAHTHDLVGKSDTNLGLVNPEAAAYRADDVAIIETGIPKLAYEETITLPTGETRWIQTSKLPLRSDEGEIIGVLGAYIDITARKAADIALQTSAAEIHDLYNNAPCGYHSLDQDGVIIQINDTELRWLGYRRDEVIHKHKFIDFCTPAAAVLFQKNFSTFKARGWVNDLEFDLVRKDGGMMHILLSSTAIYDEQACYIQSRSSLFDITELKRFQQALMDSELRYRLLAENVSDVIARTGPDGVRRFITPSCYALLGYQPEELIGKSIFDIVNPEDRSKFQAKLQQAIRAGDSSFTITHRLQHKAGYAIWVEITNTLVCQADTGQLVEIIGVFRDVTERKRTESALTVRMEEEREFQEYLKALHEITIELTPIEDLATFYARIIELGRSVLGFDRMALFLYAEQDGAALGTYGTNARGEIVNEQHIRFVPSKLSIMFRAFQRSERFCYEEYTMLYDNNQPFGMGWNAATVLWNGTQKLGWLVVDNLLQQKPASKPLLDTLGLYGLTIGTLLTQKRIQLALRESEARYRLLAENITDVVMRTDGDFAYVYVSPSSRTVLGYEPAELIGQPAVAYVHPDDLPTIIAILVEKPPIITLLLRFRHKQGHYIWLESNGRMIRSATGVITEFISSSRDVSDRKAAEKALKESEEKYRHLIETMRGGLAVYDETDRVTYVNDRACELLGYTREEILGTRPYDYVDTPAAEAIKAQLSQRRLFLGTPYELTVRRKDGTPVHLLISGSPLFDKKGAYSGSLVITADITVQKQAEDTLRQALAKEKELSELKSRFVSMASHEFRTPLATILALTETLSAYRHKLSDTQVEQRFDKIKEQIQHLKEIMEDVLLLARMQARRVEFNPMELDLDALCRSVLDEFQGLKESKPQIEYHSHGAAGPVYLDVKLMRQILSNLLSNAVKYSAPERLIVLTLEFTAKLLTLTVCDQGIGIPAADLPHLFEPFHRAANVGNISGTGLGLVITKEAVELHGGTISVNSRVNQGTTFVIQLPVTTSLPLTLASATPLPL